jgi:monoamine oxidase
VEHEGIFGGRVHTDLPLGQFCYPSNGYHSKKGVLLGFYGNSEIGGLRERSNAERVEHVLEHASKFHPQIREELESAYCVFWEKIRYSEGAYATGAGGWTDPGGPRVEQLSKADRRIYIGCAAASSSPAWMEGAISAAWRTVESLHERVMQS